MRPNELMTRERWLDAALRSRTLADPADMRLTTVPSARTAVVVHVYYPDVWPLIRARLQQLTHIPFDLFVSVALQHQFLGETITEDFKKATVLMIPNRGRD